MNREEIIQGLVECATNNYGDTIRIKDLEKLIELAIKNIGSQEKLEDTKSIISRLDCYKLTHPDKIPINELEITLMEIVYKSESKKDTNYNHTK